jgi:sugar lactone lactonase YvrE
MRPDMAITCVARVGALVGEGPVWDDRGKPILADADANRHGAAA